MPTPEAILIANQGVYFPSIHEVVTVILNVGVGHWMMVAGLIIWLIALTRPLTGIDQRDSITGLSFTAFFLGFGTFLIIALPALAAAKTRDFGKSCGILAIMLALSSLRWFWRRQARIDSYKHRMAQKGAGKS